MANYTQTTFFTPKDTLPPTNPAKTIFGAAYDVEFGNISTAIASKPDATTAASFLSLTIGTPTGGNLGPGSINAQSIFVNNTAVLTSLAGAVTSITGTANQIAASASTGAVTLSLPQNVVIPTPAGGVALTVSGVNGQTYILVDGTNPTFSLVDTGANAAFLQFSQSNASGAIINASASVSLPSGLHLQTGNADRLVISPSGGVAVVAPSSGTAITITAVAGSQAFSIVGAASGIGTFNGTGNGASVAFQRNSTSIADIGSGDAVFGGSATQFAVGARSGITLGLGANGALGLTFSTANGLFTVGATGGDQGAGTFNATGLFINAGQLFFGVPQSASTTAAVTDVGKCINAAGTITVPNAVFSAGHAFSIYNNTAGSITITAGITTMRLAGSATTGSRTLAQRGMATVWFESGTECIIGGPGVA